MSHSDKFRIEIHLGSPLVSSGTPMYLDSLLGAVNNGKHHLDVSEHGSIKGSQFFFESMTDDMIKTGFTKRIEHQKAYNEEKDNHSSSSTGTGLLCESLRVGSVVSKSYKIGSNRLKNYGGPDRFIASQWVKKATAWGIGDKQKVMELLSRVSNLGAKSRLGYGHVLSIDVIDDERAEEYWRYRVLAQEEPIDEHEEDNYVPHLSPIRGPYWQKNAAVPAKLYIGTPECTLTSTS